MAQYIFVGVFFFNKSFLFTEILCFGILAEDYPKRQILEGFQMNLLNVCSHLDCASLAHWDALGGALRRETMVLWDGGRSEGRGRCSY